MVKCDLCGKELKNTQALRGHKNFIHGYTGTNTQTPAADRPPETQINALEDRLQQLERIIGVSDLRNDTGPVTEKLVNINEKVSKLTEDTELAVISLNDKARAIEVRQEELLGIYSKVVEAVLNEQVAPRLQYLERGYSELLNRAFPPGIAERKWREYRTAVGGRALSERCSLDKHPPIQIKLNRDLA